MEAYPESAIVATSYALFCAAFDKLRSDILATIPEPLLDCRYLIHQMETG